MSTGEKQSLGVHIRWMIRRDMTEVLAIEDGSFEFPWTEDDFIRCLRQRNCSGAELLEERTLLLELVTALGAPLEVMLHPLGCID